MLLEPEEKQQILDLVDRYRTLHDEIAKIEASIVSFQESLKTLYKDKDSIINGIESNRENESTVIKGLVKKYGEGKLNLESFEWINNK